MNPGRSAHRGRVARPARTRSATPEVASAVERVVPLTHEDGLMSDEKTFRARVRGPVFDCGDAIELAEFYSGLLDWPIVDRAEGGTRGQHPGPSWAQIQSPDGLSKLEFQGLWDYRPPVWPNTEGEQQMMIHLDIVASDPSALDWCW